MGWASTLEQPDGDPFACCGVALGNLHAIVLDHPPCGNAAHRTIHLFSLLIASDWLPTPKMFAPHLAPNPHPTLSHSLRSQERVSYAALTYRGQPEQCSRLGEDETLRKRGSYKEEHPFFGTEKTEIQSEGFDQLTMASTSPSPASAASGRGRGEGAPAPGNAQGGAGRLFRCAHFRPKMS